MPFTEILSRLEKAIPHAEKANDKISRRGVDWHLEHSLKIIQSICKNMAESKPEAYSPKFNLVKYYILWTGKIPRGKGKSPKLFNNKESIDTSKLSYHLDAAKDALKTIRNLHPNQHFPHPLFGDLNVEKAYKFINIHTKHHLDIIDDIVKSK